MIAAPHQARTGTQLDPNMLPISPALTRTHCHHTPTLCRDPTQVLASRSIPTATLTLTLTLTLTANVTERYLPPEVYRPPHSHGPPADWFALGVTLYELMLGRKPFSRQVSLYAFSYI